MTIKVGYLLPTRERVMAGVHETGPILELAERCETVGLDSVWGATHCKRSRDMIRLRS